MANVALNIDIISDVVCPWCVIGYGRLQKALSKLTNEITVNFTWHPFELNPNMSHQGENLRAHLAEKYGTSLEGSIKARAMLTEEGAKIGFQFNYFDEMKMLNTLDCHQLLHWAKGTGRQTALAEALFAQFFSLQGEFSHDELLAIVEQVGLDKTQAQVILQQQPYVDEIRAIEQHWHQQGIHGVPLFIFNGIEVLSGAQEVATFEQVISQIIAKQENA